MHHQKNQLRRDALNNPRIYQAILETVGKGMAPCVRVSDRHNAIHAADDFIRCLTRAAVSNGQVAGCTMSALEVPTTPGISRSPTDGWIRSVAIKSEPGRILDCLAETVGRQLDQLRETGMITRGQKLEAAIDMHPMPRYDKKHGAGLCTPGRRAERMSLSATSPYSVL